MSFRDFIVETDRGRLHWMDAILAAEYDLQGPKIGLAEPAKIFHVKPYKLLWTSSFFTRPPSSFYWGGIERYAHWAAEKTLESKVVIYSRGFIGKNPYILYAAIGDRSRKMLAVDLKEKDAYFQLFTTKDMDVKLNF